MSLADRVVRAVQWLFLLVGVGLLGFGLFGVGNTWLKVAEARRWPTTQGVILNRDWRSVHWVGRASSGTRFVPEIRYRYAIDGTTYVSENVYPATSEQWSSEQELQAFMDAGFPARGAVTVSYDPAAPSRSAIILRGSYWTAITLAMCGLVALLGLFAMRFALRQRAEG